MPEQKAGQKVAGSKNALHKKEENYYFDLKKLRLRKK